MLEQEKNKERELIEEIYKLVKELKEEKQEAETPVPANIQSFLDFLKTQKGQRLIRLFSFIVSLGITRSKVKSFTIAEIYNFIDQDLENL